MLAFRTLFRFAVRLRKWASGFCQFKFPLPRNCLPNVSLLPHKRSREELRWRRCSLECDRISISGYCAVVRCGCKGQFLYSCCQSFPDNVNFSSLFDFPLFSVSSRTDLGGIFIDDFSIRYLFSICYLLFADLLCLLWLQCD
jgi:hypothetical protein